MRINFKKGYRLRHGSGFTLIELLVVVAILGLLASLIVISTNESRARGRDARRIADIQAMTDAIELFLDENVLPPDITTWPALQTDLEEYFRGKAFPQDPNFSESGNYYHYVVCTSQRNYLVASLLETEKDILGDIDDTVTGYTLASECVMDDNSAPSALNCSDVITTGSVNGRNGSVLCQGYLDS